MAENGGTATFRTSAEAYDRHIGRYGPALARALLEAANVSAGQRALDVGCGPGALTAALCELLSSDQVAAVDPSGPFAAYAASLPEERRAALREELRGRLGAADEPFRLTSRAWAVVGETP